MEEALNSEVFKPTRTCGPGDLQAHLQNKYGLTSHYALISVPLTGQALRRSAGKPLLTCFKPE